MTDTTFSDIYIATDALLETAIGANPHAAAAPASGLEAVWEMTHDDKPWTVAATGGSYP